MTDPSIDGISLLVLIFGMVEFLKKFKLSGKALTIASMSLGIIFGVGYKATLTFPQISVWMEWIVYGLAFGLAACGLYDFAAARLPKQNE